MAARRPGGLSLWLFVLGVQASACSGGNGFTAGTPDGSSPDGSMNSSDSDGGFVVVVNPGGDDASADAGGLGAVADATVNPAVDAAATAQDAAPDVLSCSASELACGGGCVPIDTNNCGACGAKCTAPTGGTASCTETSHAYSCGIACGANLTHCGSSCVDLQTDKNNCGRCGHGCVAGACTTGQCQSWVVTHTSALNADLGFARAGLYGQFDMVTDGTSIVWIDPTQGVLQVSATAGPSSPVINLSPMQPSNTASPGSLAMAHGVVVWAMEDVNSGVSVWAATEGGANTGAPVGSLGVSSAGDLPSGMALDATGSTAYFLDTLNGSGAAPHSPGLFKCVLASKSCALLYSANPPQTFLLANDVAIAGSRLFWTDSAAGQIWRADYSVNAVGSVVPNQSGPSLLTVDATYVYWGNVVLSDAGVYGTFSIARTSQSNPAAPTTVVPSVSGILGGMGSDGTNLYFIQLNPGNNKLLYVPADGSALPQSLKANQQPDAIAVGGGAVYWLNGDDTIDGIATP